MDDKTKAPRWTLFFTITSICFLLDALSKHIMSVWLYGRMPVKVIGEYIQFMLVYNRGALFGFDPRHYIPWFPINAFFFVFSIVAIAVIIVYYKSVPRTDFVMQWGLMLILPGALGNLFDRIIHPKLGVVDFIRIGFSETVYWPIFNLADTYVTIGVVLVFINFLHEERQKACQKNS